VTVDEVIARVPAWGGRRVVRVTPLDGGITNENHRVEIDGEAFVVRVGGRDTDLLGIDRHREWMTARAVARLGLGPEVLFGLPEAGVLVTRWVAGRTLDAEGVQAPGVMTRVAAVIRRIHAVPPVDGAFSPFRAAEAYTEVARRRAVALPPGLDDWLALGRRIETALAPAAATLCHNDLLPANLIDDGHVIRVLDWEYAAMGDPFFDLANLAANAELDADAEERLVTAYFGGRAPPEALRRLRLLRVASDLREATWALVQAGISRLAFDFGAYADRYLARVAAGAATLQI
jgi:thiamine kinase-like enzyme